jgi:hypothetical protein
VFDCAATILCGSDTVTDPVTSRIITPLPHDIAQLLTSPHVNCNHSICHQFVVVILVVVSLLHVNHLRGLVVASAHQRGTMMAADAK